MNQPRLTPKEWEYLATPPTNHTHIGIVIRLAIFIVLVITINILAFNAGYRMALNTF